jgi:outer membrane protein insertion porin family
MKQKNKQAFFLILGLLLFVACPAVAAAPVVGKIEVKGLVSIGKEELLGLLGIRTGDVLDPAAVREGIKRAFLKGIFNDIEVSANEARTEVQVVVQERDRIRNVEVVGNEFFSDREIRRMFPLKEGTVLRYDLLGSAAKGLKDMLVQRGFPSASVSASVASTSKPYAEDIVLTISEGRPLVIDRLEIHGAPEDEVKRVIHIDKGDRYDLKAVESDMDRIREHYKDLGYLNPSASCSFADGKLDIEVTLGKKLQINFEGNTVFSSKKLMKEMPFRDAGAVRDDLIEDAVRKIISLYYAKGYSSAQAAPVESGADDTITLNFFIFEGEQNEVGELKFPGMSLPEKNLKAVLPLKEGDYYDPSLLYSDVDMVREFYIALGYLAVEVEAPRVEIKKKEATITIPVKEGPKTIIDKVAVSGAISVPPEEIQKAIRLKKGSPYNEVDIADARQRVIDLYSEKGFINVAINAKVEFSGENANISFDIREGERIFFGKTIVTGNVRTKTEVIERELLHKESAPFNYGILSKERQRLYRLGLFTEVRIEPLDLYDHRRDIRVDVVEGNAGSVEFGIGYSNYDKLNGFVDIGYKNLFGMNRQVSLRVGYNSLEKLYAINYVDPWFLSKRLALKGTLYRNEREEKNIDTKVVMYRYRKYGVSLGVEKQLTDAMKGEVYYDYVISNTFEVQPDIVLTDRDAGKLSISSIRPGITYDTRDNPFEPRKGVLAGLTAKLSSSAIFSQTNFAKAVFNGSVYQEISKPFVVAAAFRFGVARAWGHSTTILPLVERFFLGGRNTVRGYAQDTLGPRGGNGNPTGGNAFVETNLELRTFLGKGIGIVTFLDSGNVWQKIGDIDFSLKHAVGIGLRYDTPVGPFRLDYGYKLKKEPGLSRGEIFFSIGQAF